MGEPSETPSAKDAKQESPAQAAESESAAAASQAGAGGPAATGERPADDASAADSDSPAGDPVAEAKAEVARIREQLLRTAADFDNYRKRSRREGVEAELRGREAFLKDILPVFDNLERAVAHGEVATDVQSLLNGIQMVMRQFADILARLGIQRIATVGSPFDPAVHEAIQHLETDAHAPGIIAAEIQAGYLAQKRLIRPAMVVVAKAKGATETQRSDDEQPAAEEPAKHDASGSQAADKNAATDEAKADDE